MGWGGPFDVLPGPLESFEEKPQQILSELNSITYQSHTPLSSVSRRRREGAGG